MRLRKSVNDRSIFVVLCIVLGIGPAVTRADESKAFRDFDRMNAIDIETARLAEQKANADATKALAKMITRDHVPIQQEARAIARRAGIAVPGDNATNPYAQALARLAATSGPDFDKAYLSHELPFSKAFVAQLKDEIVPAIRDAELKRYLLGLVPKFDQHLMHIEHTARQIEGGQDASGSAHHDAGHHGGMH